MAALSVDGHYTKSGEIVAGDAPASPASSKPCATSAPASQRDLAPGAGLRSRAEENKRRMRRVRRILERSTASRQYRHRRAGVSKRSRAYRASWASIS